MDVAELGIKVDSSGAVQNLNNFDRAAAKSTTTVNALRGALGTFGLAISGGLLFKKLVDDTAAAQASMAQLRAAVASTGGAAGLTVRELDGLSAALQRTSSFSDDAVQAAESLLLTFTQIKSDNFARATQAVADLTARMGGGDGGLAGAAVQVGKALNDPVQGISALQRVGVSFSESQKKVIKDLAETGRVAEAQRLILKELENEFGGSAAAARNTLGGALRGLQNDFGNLFEVSEGGSAGAVNAINALGGVLQQLKQHMDTVLAVTGALAVAAVAGGAAWTVFAVAAARAAIATAVVGSLQTIQAFIALAKTIRSTADAMALLSLTGGSAAKVVIAIAAVTAGFIAYKVIAKQIADETARFNAELDKLGSGGGTGAGTGATSAATDAFKERADAMAGELAKLNALNSAHGQTETELKTLEILYDAAIENSKLAADFHGRELTVLRNLNNATADAKIRALELADATAQYNAVLERQLDVRKQLGSLRENLKTALDTQGYGTPNPSKSDANAKAADENFARWARENKQIEDAAEAAAKKYADDMQAIWRRGIGKLVTDGTKSFRDFFEDVSRMFSDLMERMAQEGKQGSKLYKGLALGSSAIAGAFSGYQVGQQTGDRFGGAFGGGLSGAVSGAAIAGPMGAVIGGLAGLGAGLFGAAQAAQDAAARLKEMRKAVDDNAATLHARAMGTENSLEEQIRTVKRDFDTQRKDALLAYGSNKEKNLGSINFALDPNGQYAQKLKEIKADEDAYVARLKEEQEIKRKYATEDLEVRFLRATGKNKEADKLAFDQQQARERQALIDSFGDEIDATEKATLAFLDVVLAAEKVRKQMDDLTTSVRNAPSGFKIERYIYEFAGARPRTSGWEGYGNPAPQGFPAAARSSSNQFQFHGPVYIDARTKTQKEAFKEWAREFNGFVAATVGPNENPAEALGLLPG